MTERRSRSAIAALADGIYEAATSSRPPTIPLRVTVASLVSGIEVDFAGSCLAGLTLPVHPAASSPSRSAR